MALNVFNRIVIVEILFKYNNFILKFSY
jgi:hypothetical protein